MSYKVVGRAKEGTRILQQPVTCKGNITRAQARRAVRLAKERAQEPA